MLISVRDIVYLSKDAFFSLNIFALVAMHNVDRDPVSGVVSIQASHTHSGSVA